MLMKLLITMNTLRRIRSLLDKHIAGIEVKEPDGAYLVGNLGKDVKPQDLSDDERLVTKRTKLLVELLK